MYGKPHPLLCKTVVILFRNEIHPLLFKDAVTTYEKLHPLFFEKEHVETNIYCYVKQQ